MRNFFVWMRGGLRTTIGKIVVALVGLFLLALAISACAALTTRLNDKPISPVVEPVATTTVP